MTVSQSGCFFSVKFCRSSEKICFVIGKKLLVYTCMLLMTKRGQDLGNGLNQQNNLTAGVCVLLKLTVYINLDVSIIIRRCCSSHVNTIHFHAVLVRVVPAFAYLNLLLYLPCFGVLVEWLMICLVFLGQGHQGIFSLVKGTLYWENCIFFTEAFHWHLKQ